jgi:integrase
LNDNPLGMVTGEKIRTWFASLNRETASQNGKAYDLLKSILGTAVKDGLLVSNPCQISRTSAPRKREPIILDVSEIGAISGAVPDQIKALVLVLAWCGPRWGEAIELRRKDIDSAVEKIFVGRSVTHEGQCRIDTTKSGKAHFVAIPPHIRADIKHHLDSYVEKSPDALLFVPSKGGCHLNDSVFKRFYLDPALKTIDKQGVRIHDLRHFAGTQAARVGNLVETMQRLGHSTPKASLIYQQIASGRDMDVAVALSALVESL